MTKQVEVHLKWSKSLENLLLTPMSSGFLRDGNIYIGGRDKQGIPYMVFSVKGLKKLTKEISQE